MSEADARSLDRPDGGWGDGKHDGGGDEHSVRIDFVGIRGGQGTSTVAAATAFLLGEIHGPVRLESHDPEGAAAMLGLSATVEDPMCVTAAAELGVPGSSSARWYRVIVSDLGCMRSAPERHEGAAGRVRIGVLRGPCYVALRTLVSADSSPLAGLVLCAEPGRSLDHRDVEDIAGVPVLASVDVTPAVARTVDAGLAPVRLAKMREFVQVRRWLASVVSGPLLGPDGSAPDAVAFRSEAVETRCTDWHLPPMAEGARLR